MLNGRSRSSNGHWHSKQARLCIAIRPVKITLTDYIRDCRIIAIQLLQPQKRKEKKGKENNDR